LFTEEGIEMVRVPLVEKAVKIPEDVQVNVENIGDKFKVAVKGPKGSIERDFVHDKLRIFVGDGEVRVICKMPRKKDKALVGTWASHIRNMVNGVKHGFTYHMRVVYSHFPIKLELKGNELLIHNFMGERWPRRAKILEGVKVEIKGKDVYLHGVNIEVVGQTAANIEKATRIKNKDPRVFQDGIYIVERRLGE